MHSSSGNYYTYARVDDISNTNFKVRMEDSSSYDIGIYAVGV